MVSAPGPLIAAWATGAKHCDLLPLGAFSRSRLWLTATRGCRCRVDGGGVKVTAGPDNTVFEADALVCTAPLVCGEEEPLPPMF